MKFRELIRNDKPLFIIVIILEILYAVGSAASSYIIQFAYNQLEKNILLGFLLFIVSSILLFFFWLLFYFLIIKLLLVWLLLQAIFLQLF